MLRLTWKKSFFFLAKYYTSLFLDHVILELQILNAYIRAFITGVLSQSMQTYTNTKYTLKKKRNVTSTCKYQKCVDDLATTSLRTCVPRICAVICSVEWKITHFLKF